MIRSIEQIRQDLEELGTVDHSTELLEMLVDFLISDVRWVVEYMSHESKVALKELTEEIS